MAVDVPVFLRNIRTEGFAETKSYSSFFDNSRVGVLMRSSWWSKGSKFSA